MGLRSVPSRIVVDGRAPCSYICNYRARAQDIRTFGLVFILLFGIPGARSHRPEGQVRNRWHFTQTLYGFRTLAFLAPALTLYEVLLFLFMLVKGLAGMYVRGNAAWLCEVGGILEKRRRAQEMRRVSDGDLLSSGPIYVNPELVRHPAWRLMVRAVTAVFDSYYFLARRCF